MALPVQTPVENQDFRPGGGGLPDRVSDAAEHYARNDGRVEAADAVDDGLGGANGFTYSGVWRW